MAARRKRTFDQAYADLQRNLARRAKVIAAEGRKLAKRREMINELGLLAAQAKALDEAGNKVEARKVFRRALILEKKLGISSAKR